MKETKTKKKEKAEELEEEQEERSQKENVWEILRTFMILGTVILLCFLFREFVLQRTVVMGESMEDTLQDGDNLLVDKISYRFSDPERFDVIVFPFEEEDGTTERYIKRIIGLPGETISIEDGKIIIDGKVLEESYGLETIKEAGFAKTPVTMAPNEYFVLGDNRNHSKDSRDLDRWGTPTVGLVKRENIIGKVWIRIFPFSKFGTIDP